MLKRTEGEIKNGHSLRGTKSLRLRLLCGIYRIRSFPKARNVKGCLVFGKHHFLAYTRTLTAAKGENRGQLQDKIDH